MKLPFVFEVLKDTLTRYLYICVRLNGDGKREGFLCRKITPKSHGYDNSSIRSRVKALPTPIASWKYSPRS